MRLNGLFTAYQPFPSKTNGLTGGLMAIFKPCHGLTKFEGCEGVEGRYHPIQKFSENESGIIYKC